MDYNPLDDEEDYHEDPWDDYDEQDYEENLEVLCQNCGRLINADNRSIDGVMCQGCQGDGCRRLIIFDWLTGGKFFG